MSLKNLAVLATGLLISAHSLTAASESELRQFVKNAVADPETFVPNPPAELNAYAGMTPEAAQKRQMDVIRNGRILVLFPNGLPMRLESRKNIKLNGESKTWYPDGQIQSEEVFADDKLMEGRYFSADGSLLSSVANGRGKCIEFDISDGGKAAKPVNEADYVDGVRDGTETRYRDFATKKIQSETQYRAGKKNGVERSWMENGQLNYSVNYSNGQEDGEAVYWYGNGNVQSRSQYKNGHTVGTNSRYAENGQMIEEIVRNGETRESERQWYPDGQLMVYKKYDPSTHDVTEAQSYDRHGALTGTVTNGLGRLVVCKNDYGETGDFSLETFAKGEMSTKKLPHPQWSSSDAGHTELNLKLKTTELGEFDEMSCSILSPTAGIAPVSVQFRNGEDKMVPVKLTLPEDYSKWSGEILCDVTLRGKDGEARFTQVLYSKKADPPAPAQTRPVSRPRPMTFFGPEKEKTVRVGEMDFPSLGDSVSAWHSRDGLWVLYAKPPTLIYRSGRTSPWTMMRQMTFRPAGLVMPGDNHLLLWGTEATNTPQKGIPYAIEESTDGGKSWKKFAIPKVDYLVDIAVSDKVMIVRGIRLPKDGSSGNTHWFQHPWIAFISNDNGEHFTEMVGASFVNLEQVTQSAIAPDGRKHAHVADSSFQDTSNVILYAAEPDVIPKRILYLGVKAAVEWSANSRILAIRSDDRFVGYYDTVTRESKIAPAPYRHQTPSAKEQSEQEEIDQLTRRKLEENSK